MKLELMNEEEQAKAFDTLCEAYPNYGRKPFSNSSRADKSLLYRGDRGLADLYGFCCVSYMLEADHQGAVIADQ